MPWSWKTTIWKRLAEKLWYNFCDFDDDVLEKITLETAEKVYGLLNLKEKWILPENISNKKVKDLLPLLWDELFLKLEWFMWENLNFNNPTVLSSSGSLPLNLESIAKLKENSSVIYIDIPLELIISRLKEMKTDRIIWMWKMTLKEILEYRKVYYDITKDYNFEVPVFDPIPNKPKDVREIEKEIIFDEFMKFYEEKIK